MSAPGWYPDPGGRPGAYRYWDGAAWSDQVTMAAPPAPTVGGGTGGRTPKAPRGGLATLGWWLLILVVIIGLVFAGLQLVNGVRNAVTGGGPVGGATNNPTANVCPTVEPTGPALLPQLTTDGRVQGGKLSYPMLGDPWSYPQLEDRMAFGRNVYSQVVEVWPNYDGKKASWVASVLVGELVAGDGFYSPQSGTELVVKCAMGAFYGDAVVNRDDKVSKAYPISGKDGWLLETHLTFDIKGLPEKGETAIFVIVETSPSSASIYYASIPDSRPDLLATARDLLTKLRVEP